MNYGRSIGLFISIIFLALSGQAQRTYSAHSVLSSGNWFKLSITRAGIYKIDIPFLNALGVSGNSIPSANIRLFGNGGQMLTESNNGPWIDDLVENSILVMDGGDGQLNGSDYILFYAPGPDEWLKDSSAKLFRFKKNLYSERAYYFLSIGGNGLRIPVGGSGGVPNVTITSFNERIVHELDTVNFLNSGKEWYGEELSDLPGRSLSRSFSVPIPGIIVNSSLQIRADCVARSVGGGSRFDISVNGQIAGQLLITSVSGAQYDLFARESNSLFSSGNAQNNNNIAFSFSPGGFNAQGWINRFELFARRNLSMNGNQVLLFRDWETVGNANGEYVISATQPGTQVWEITDPFHPVKMNTSQLGTEMRFVNDCSRLREYIAFASTNLQTPFADGRVNNQDLHNSSPVDLLIVSSASFLQQAQRLATIHTTRGLRVKVTSTTEVYNEFSGGNPDPSGIRNFVKMYWDKYRSGNDQLKYLLLFGDASFDPKDRVRNNTNLVPCWESDNSLDPLGSYTSDDFFGFLDDNEDINSGAVTNLLDIGIGRVPARNEQEAMAFVDKLTGYLSPASLGPWRNEMNFVADDEDNNLHFNDAETISTTAAATAPVFNLQKIYLDAYQQESGAGGSQYPQANQAINSKIYNGTLIWNYNGHGGPVRLAEETIVDQSIIEGWNNINKLPLFITATCDFAPYDNPLLNSIGENLLLRPASGGIALMTTTRPVFAFSNRIMNNNYMQFALQRDVNGKYRSLGEAIKDAKNFTYQNLGDIANNRKFTLLGDPAITCAFPFLKVRITRINGNPATSDTLRATANTLIEGEVTDLQGNILNDFNGRVYPMLFDKPQTVNTRGNDPGSQPAPFLTQSNILFRGKATVSNGHFSFNFRMPKDINYQYGNGKLSLYAEDSSRDANGAFTQLIIGGSAVDNSGDQTGPVLKGYFNDESFVNGGITDQRPVLIIKLSDSSGINTAGTGIDHDIVATLDNDNRQYFILNDYYQGELDNFRKGTVRYQMPALEPGSHTLRIKAWDVLNNSSEINLEFTVAKDEQLQLAHVLNYPNPFTTSTRFWFEHNKPGQILDVHLQVMTITGRVVKTIQRKIITEGNRSAELEWDGRDEQGDRLGRGVYLYKLRVRMEGGITKEVLEKLVIL